MIIKVKKKNKDGIVRLESKCDLKEILINEDLLNPKKESVAVCFMGKDSSGIIEFSPSEIEKLLKGTKNKINLVKNTKTFKF
ncbi:MAG: hypothetical protein ACOC3X_02400 [Nanoarchaeota archaeon]